MKVYFDNAATSPIHPEVKEEMISMMDDFFGNPSSIHALGRQAKSKIEKARKIIANGLDASIGEIFFTSSASESNNTILRMAVENLEVTNIITCATEHPCVINTCKDLEKSNKIKLHLLDVNSEGEIQLDQLKSLIVQAEGKTLVSLMYGNNEIGVIHPLSEISKICEEHNTFLHTDAVQILGKFPINVNEIKIHFLSGTGHKFYGPKGAGFMYINSESIIHPLLTGGAQERNMRAGTENQYGIVGLAKAFELSLLEMDQRKDAILKVRNHMKNELIQNFDDIEFNGPQTGNFLYHILSVSFAGTPKNEMLMYNLDIKGICASAGSACSSGTNTGSHVLAAILPDSLRNTIRFSFSHWNTIEEVDYVISTLKELL